MNAFSRHACAHCQAPLLPGQAQFCCGGCEAAYAVVAGLGLDAFYRRRQGAAGLLRPAVDLPAVDFAVHATKAGDGEHEVDLLVTGLTCGACVWVVEQVMAAEPDVLRARVSLSARRLSLRWRGPASRADVLAGLVAGLGFRVVPWSPACLRASEDAEGRVLLRALGIAAFGAVNVMLISIAVWAGAGMGDATRGLLHWLAAGIALPVVAVAGLPFYRSAWGAVRAGRANMDMAVSLAVLLTTAMSLSEAIRNGPYTWFDSATSLLALLLAGRVLDRNARGRTRRALAGLLALQQGDVQVLLPDGVRTMPAEAVQPGMRVLVASGERLLLDGTLDTGTALLDTAATTGESLPRPFAAGEDLPASAINLGAPFTMTVRCSAKDGSLAHMARLMQQAEQARSRFTAVADGAARFYVPAVHAAAAGTFMLWTLALDAPWQVALVHAVSVLIITCPCGLAIAVPAVQVVTVGALFRRGVLVGSGTALERLAGVDMVVLDKTGTLTEGRPDLLPDAWRPGALQAAASLACASRHPLARALVRACPGAPAAEGVQEVPGQGLQRDGERLGNAAFCGVPANPDAGTTLWYTAPGQSPTAFRFTDRLRPDAAASVAAFRKLGLDVELLSGDTPTAVAAAAGQAGISQWQAAATPADKAAGIADLLRRGRPLMVGDGINDAGALALAHASATLADATGLAQAVSDIVVQGTQLSALPDAILAARRAMRLSRQNIALSVAYNVIAVPAAVLGLVTPVLAALVMASSSLVVILNALRAADSASMVGTGARNPERSRHVRNEPSNPARQPS